MTGDEKLQRSIEVRDGVLALLADMKRERGAKPARPTVTVLQDFEEAMEEHREAMEGLRARIAGSPQLRLIDGGKDA